MASIREHHGAWQVRYRDPQGVQRARTFDRKTDARRYANTIETDVDRGDWIDPALARTPLGPFAEAWLSEAAHLAAKTRYGYEGLLRALITPAFGDLALGRISTQAVRSWAAGLADAGLSAARQRQAVQLLKQIMDAAVIGGHIRRSPVVGVKVTPTPRRQVRVIEPEQVDALAAAIEPPYGVLVYVLAYGGLRFGEAAALQRADVDPLRSRIRVERSLSEVGGRVHVGSTKTHARRWARLPRFVSELLAEHLLRVVDVEPTAPLFASPDGGPLRHRNFLSRIWVPAAETTGLPGLRPHDLRHTAASFLIRRGASIRLVAEQLGHSTPVVTLSVYSHLYDGDLDRLYDGIDGGPAKSSVDQMWTRAGRPSADGGAHPI